MSNDPSPNTRQKPTGTDRHQISCSSAYIGSRVPCCWARAGKHGKLPLRLRLSLFDLDSAPFFSLPNTYLQGSIQKTISRFEITAVYTHPEASVDVVLVHGLNGDPKNTWMAKDSHNHSIFWPADLLPASLRGLQANVLVYGYNADVYSTKNDHSASDNFIYQHAQSLVTTLTLYRKSEGSSHNPIIWVAHSLGGLLVKRCLLYSNDVKDRNHEDYRAIFVSTYGIVFLGTPHGGSDMAKWGQIIQNMSDAIIPRKLFDSESVLLKTLKKDNETLQNINIHFLDIYQRFKIHMVHENHKTDIKGTKMLVVDARSAGPQLPGVTYYGIEATHSGMCKFPDQSAPGYRNVSTAIRDWVRESPSVIQTRWIVERDDKRVRAQTEAAERTREYSGTYSTPLPSPADTPSTTAFPSQTESQPDLRSSWPPFIHPDRFRPNAFFKGREQEHKDLHRMLMDTRRRQEGTSAVLIQGIPGAGKSHLARQYVFDHKDDYPGGIYWIRSTTVQDMEEGFWRIAKTEAIRQRVGQEKKDDLSDPQKMVKIVRNWFNEFNGWLLVLDGIRFDNDKVTNFIPDCKNTSLILTSTERPDPGNYLLDNPSIMELALLPAQAARDLLLQEMGKREPYTSDDLRRALELVQLMDRLPLMIHAAAQQMNATREPLAKYLKSFRDKPRPGMLPAYKTIRDQLQTLGDTSALNLMYILCFFSQLVPVEMLALGLKALDRTTPIRTDANGKPRSLNKTFITLIRFALIERSEMDDIPSSSSRTSERSDDPVAEPLDVLRIHSVVQAFFIQLLGEEKQLEFWLARAARIFCLSFDAADDRMKKDPTTGLPDDYRRYAIHGKKLMEHLDRSCKSKGLSEDVAAELSALRQNLKSKLSTLPKEIDGLQRAISAGIVDGKEVLDHCSVFERTNSLSSDSTNTSHATSAHFDDREPDESMPCVPQADSDNDHPTPRPPAYSPGSRYAEHFSDSRTVVPYPPDTVDASFDERADPDAEWTIVRKHRSVKKQEQRRYHDRGGAWRETSVNDPRTSVSRASAPGLIFLPGSTRGARSPSHSRISARSDAELELMHIKQASPPPPRGGGQIQDKGRSSSTGIGTKPWPVLGRTSYAQALSGTAVEDEIPPSPTFSCPPSRAGTLDRRVNYDAMSVNSLRTVEIPAQSLSVRLRENQPPFRTGIGSNPVDNQPSSIPQETVVRKTPSPSQNFVSSILQRLRGSPGEHKAEAKGKARSKRSKDSLKSQPSTSAEHHPNTYQGGDRTANSSPGAQFSPFYPPGLQVVTNSSSSLWRAASERQYASQQPTESYYAGEDYGEPLSWSDPSLGYPAVNVSSPATMTPLSPTCARPPGGYTSQPMSRNPSSNPHVVGLAESSSTPRSSNSGGARTNLGRPRAPSVVETEPSPRLQPIDMPPTSYHAWERRTHHRGDSLFGGSNVPAHRYLPTAQMPSFRSQQDSPDISSPRASPQIGAGGESMSRSGSGGIRVGDGRVIAFGEVPVDLEAAGRRAREARDRLDGVDRATLWAVDDARAVRAGHDGADPDSAPVGLGIL